MKRLSALAFTLVSISSFTLEKTSNPCWNTYLSPEAELACNQVCLPAVAAIVSDLVLSPCLKEQTAFNQCINDFSNCQNYEELLIANDNCRTNLVKACFANL